MNDLYYYISQLQQYVQKQEVRIQKLEKTVEILRKDMLVVKDRPPVHVERMEYKFDQLKVENLEGTLNIGLNPSDLQDIDDFSIDNKGLPSQQIPKFKIQRVIELEDQIFQYIEDEIPTIFRNTLSKLHTHVDESYINFIKEDIKKQIPTRIEFYLKQLTPTERQTENITETNAKILEHLKKEIQNGVYAFINHLPENVKGMKQE